MLIRTAAGATLVGIGLSLTCFSSAQALTMTECSAKYQTAQKANTLNGQKWNDFRKTQCGADATVTPAAAAAPAAAAPAAAPKPAPAPAPAAVAPKPAPAAVAPAPAAAGAPVFPRAVDPKYSNLSAGKQRFQTCDDQYKANKATGGNGGLQWIMKGGGYYSQCNKALKGV